MYIIYLHFLALQSKSYLKTHYYYYYNCHYYYYDNCHYCVYPLSQANRIRPIIPSPSFSIHVIVAATGEAELSPTPTPFNMACVANVPVMYEQKAYSM